MDPLDKLDMILRNLEQALKEISRIENETERLRLLAKWQVINDKIDKVLNKL